MGHRAATTKTTNVFALEIKIGSCVPKLNFSAQVLDRPIDRSSRVIVNTRKNPSSRHVFSQRNAILRTAAISRNLVFVHDGTLARYRFLRVNFSKTQNQDSKDPFPGVTGIHGLGHGLRGHGIRSWISICLSFGFLHGMWSPCISEASPLDCDIFASHQRFLNQDECEEKMSSRRW